MTVFEAKLRARPESLLAQRPPAVPVSVAERDALADAVEALRALLDPQGTDIRDRRARKKGRAALARLDAA